MELVKTQQFLQALKKMYQTYVNYYNQHLKDVIPRPLSFEEFSKIYSDYFNRVSVISRFSSFYRDKNDAVDKLVSEYLKTIQEFVEAHNLPGKTGNEEKKENV